MGESKTIRLLLVEESLVNVALVQGRLAEIHSMKFLLAHADSLDTALARLRQTEFDVVLLDLDLPDSQGLQGVRRILDLAPAMPLLALTSSKDEEQGALAIQAGAQDCLNREHLEAYRLAPAIRNAIQRAKLRANELVAKAKMETAEQELREAAERFGLVARATNDAIWDWDLVQGDLWWNESIQTLFGYPEKEVGRFARWWSEAIHPDDRQRVDTLIQDLLDIAKIEAGRLALSRKLLDAESLVREAIDLHEALVMPKSIRLESQLDLDLPLLHADRNRIQQVFGNLIGNALKFTPEGGRILIRVQTDLQGMLFSVSDTGIGIAEEHHTRLFEPYWQAQSTGRANAGLGLAIVKGIVEAHGGRIWVESTLGSGSTFFFILPQGDTSNGSEPDQDS